MVPYVNMDITVTPAAATAAGVSRLLHHDGGKIQPRRFLLLAHSNATWQRLGFILWAGEELPQIYTASYSRGDGGGDESWKTTEMLQYMLKKQKQKNPS